MERKVSSGEEVEKLNLSKASSIEQDPIPGKRVSGHSSEDSDSDSDSQVKFDSENPMKQQAFGDKFLKNKNSNSVKLSQSPQAKKKELFKKCSLARGLELGSESQGFTLSHRLGLVDSMNASSNKMTSKFQLQRPESNHRSISIFNRNRTIIFNNVNKNDSESKRQSMINKMTKSTTDYNQSGLFSNSFLVEKQVYSFIRELRSFMRHLQSNSYTQGHGDDFKFLTSLNKKQPSKSYFLSLLVEDLKQKIEVRINLLSKYSFH